MSILKKNGLIFICFFLLSCSNIKSQKLINNNYMVDNLYTKIELKIPKSIGVKERYIPQKGEKVYGSMDKLPFKGGVILDPTTMKPANGITKSYDKNGTLLHEAKLLNGKLFGYRYNYGENGNLLASRKYNDQGREYGFQIFYFPNGKIKEIYISYNKMRNDNYLESITEKILEYNKKGEMIYENY